MTALRKRLHAVSLDYDGCYGSNYSDTTPLVETQNSLLNEIYKNQDPKVLFVGSNRQDHRINNVNQYNNDNGCCFTEMVKLEKHLKAKFKPIPVTLNKLLLADIDSDNEPGHCFDRPADTKDIHHNWDQSKLRIIYAQMQMLAAENPNAVIQYDFYDDRYNMLEDLLDTINKYPGLKPGNVYLNAIGWTGRGTPKLIGSCGFSHAPIDYNWQHNTKLLGSDIYCTGYDERRQVDVSKIPEFLQARNLGVAPVSLRPTSDEEKTPVAAHQVGVFTPPAASVVPITSHVSVVSPKSPASSPVKPSDNETLLPRGIDGEVFRKIIESYQSTSCLSCCGLFKRSSSIRALSKLVGKERVTLRQISDALRTERKFFNLFTDTRRNDLFFGKGKVNGTDTDNIIVKLSKNITGVNTI